MFDKWWETHPRIKHWWETGNNNASNVCPDWFANRIGYSLGYSLLDMAASTEKNIGLKTELNVVMKAGTTMEKLNSAVILANTWCFFGGVGGHIDATYQEFHDGNHLGTAIVDKTVEWWEKTVSWYESEEKGVDNFLRGAYKWWKS